MKKAEHEKSFFSVVTRIVSVLLAFVLSCFVSLGVLTWMGLHLVQDSTMQREAGRACLSAQVEQLHAVVEEAAAQWHFDPACVQQLITSDALSTYQDEVIDWFTGLWDGRLTAMPAWNGTEMVDAIRTDPLFMEHVPALDRRVVARDSIVADLSRAIERAVFPMRHQLIVTGLELAQQRMDLFGLVRRASMVPLCLFLFALASCALLALVCRRALSRALAFIGSALVASVLVMLSFSLFVVWLNIPAACGAISPFLQRGAAALGMAAFWRMAVLWVLLLFAGFVLIHLHCRAMKKRVTNPT